VYTAQALGADRPREERVGSRHGACWCAPHLRPALALTRITDQEPAPRPIGASALTLVYNTPSVPPLRPAPRSGLPPFSSLLCVTWRWVVCRPLIRPNSSPPQSSPPLTARRRRSTYHERDDRLPAARGLGRARRHRHLQLCVTVPACPAHPLTPAPPQSRMATTR
jgi:hypothetical protein